MSDTYRGALWMAMYALAYSVMVGVARHLSTDFSTFEIVFFRALVAALAVAPWVLTTGISHLRTERLGGHLQRALFGFGAQASWFYAISVAPLGDAVAVQFVLPLLTVLAAAIFLGEQVTRSRWIATGIGFLGMLIIVRPGFVQIEIGLGAALLSALLYAGANVTAKDLARTESTIAVIFYINVLMLPLAFLPAAYTWDGLELHNVPWLILLGLLGFAANFCLAQSYVAADASAVISIDFLRLPFSAWIGYTYFGQSTDLWTWIGAAVIVAGCYFLAKTDHKR